ncbi:MAG: cation transporter [Acidobacteriaceae bacterium]
MSGLFPTRSPLPHAQVCAPERRHATAIFWLQGITLAWMLVETAVSLYAAVEAHSPAMLAFGSDSIVELFSASVVLLQFVPQVSISERIAGRTAGTLLFLLALVVLLIAVLSLALHLRPETSCAGIGITIAAIIAMPILAGLKRREARRRNNPALAADATQSATCAYLAFITLVGLSLNAIFHIGWFDSVAALVAIPFLLKEGRAAWRGTPSGCC